MTTLTLSYVQETDIPYDSIMDFLAWIDTYSHYVKVGVWKPKQATYATYVEFGVPGKLRARPLFRDTFDEQVDNMVADMAAILGAGIKTGRTAPMTLTNHMLEFAADSYIYAIRHKVLVEGPFAPNKRASITDKGNSTPWLGPDAMYRANHGIKHFHVIDVLDLKTYLGNGRDPKNRKKPRIETGPKRRPLATVDAEPFTAGDFFRAAIKGIGQGMGGSTGRGKRRGSRRGSYLKRSLKSYVSHASADTQLLSFKKSSSKKHTRTRFKLKGAKSRRYKQRF